ncbi:DUF3800 domain-containing protein [Paenarthrobacter sp. NPDC089989]|uniref:DUF3800 domain-containing protein n=1 Tax=unclassified Paenarthrobacter TaxID=2634190 RepID=UPI003829C3CC
MWNDAQAEAGTYAFVSMDGNGSDPSYVEAHRSLPLESRHVIEDPMFHDSRRSQWIQMADLVAYSAFTHLNRHAGNEFGWDWYTHYLSRKAPHNAPWAI